MNNLDKDFVPYPESLAMKELGFDEPCLAIYNKDREFSTVGDLRCPYTYLNNTHPIHKYGNGIVCIPTYSQAFRWFREKYNLDGHVTFRESPSNKIEGINSVYYDIEIYRLQSGDAYKIYRFKEISDIKEQAELNCLQKLIELCKTNM